MVSSVEITGGNLVITFNTDSGKQPISIPLTDIFNPDNYYDKTATDNKLADKADKVANATGDNFAALDENGNLKDSGKKPGDFQPALDFTPEDSTNKTKTISEESTDTQYPSAKAVYDAIQQGGGGQTDIGLSIVDGLINVTFEN